MFNAEKFFNDAIALYSRTAFTKDMIIGYRNRNVIMYYRATLNEVAKFFTIDNYRKSIRGRWSSFSMNYMNTHGARRLCTVEEFEEVKASRAKNNNGDAFECIVTEKVGGYEWKGHDSTPYTIAGDAMIDGMPVQCKFTSCTLMTLEYYEQHKND